MKLPLARADSAEGLTHYPSLRVQPAASQTHRFEWHRHKAEGGILWLFGSRTRHQDTLRNLLSNQA